MKLNWFSPGIRRRRMSRGSWHSAQGSRIRCGAGAGCRWAHLATTGGITKWRADGSSHQLFISIISHSLWSETLKKWVIATKSLASWGWATAAAFGSWRTCGMLKKCLRHFSPAHGASTNIKDSLVLLCGKAFKSELNSALLSSCVASSPSPYFSSGYFPSLPSSDLTASSSSIYYFFSSHFFSFPFLTSCQDCTQPAFKLG